MSGIATGVCRDGAHSDELCLPGESSVSAQSSMASTRPCGIQIYSLLCLFSFTDGSENSH